AVVAARDAGDRLLTAPGSLGVLDQVTDRAIALGHGDLPAGVLVLAAADHPVAEHGISAYPAEITREVLAAAAAGEAMGVAAARSAGLRVELVDAGVAGDPVAGVDRIACLDPRGDLVAADAMSAADTSRVVDAGRVVGRRVAAGGLVALGEVGVGNTTVAAALTCGLLDVAAQAAVGLGASADTDMLDRKRAVVNAALARARAAHGANLADPLVALGALGGPEIATLAGVVLGAADAGAVVVLDGLATSIAALCAVRVEPGVAAHLVAGQRSRELGHSLVLAELGLEPVLDLRIRAGEGVGACLAATLVREALTLRRTAARVSY
ncbi:MAG TPA: nicotinate-nucleotide--dimethylbenzimidazole phosphoribosyltransferase, partial [Mycobacteriales bacterium]|nr:nicotinate-nucleotide--dimethylbenzimidazole phosphoribosyltransferase [Mycobacteriales bacterium]